MRVGGPIVVLLAAVLAMSPARAEVGFPRHPAPSPDGEQIAFSWQGDIWLVDADGGVARRLSAHPGYDRAPIWSPDGSLLAFTSDRTGSDDVFVMPTVGGAARRLTFYSGSDHAHDFTPDGEAILFTSSRDAHDGRRPGVYRVPVDGGTPVRALPATANAVASRDDGAIVFSRGGAGAPWWRRGYRGPANHDLWLHRPADGTVTRLHAFDAPELHPSWSGGLRGTVFLSEETGNHEVWILPDAGGPARRLTDLGEEGARFPRAARNADLVAFERGTGLWTLRPGAAATELTLDAPGDSPVGPLDHLDIDEVSEMAVSPDGEEIAVVFHGEIFIRRADPDAPELTRVTHSPGRDHELAWTPDSESLVFVSDRDGRRDLYEVRSTDPDMPRLVYARSHAVSRLTDTEVDEHSPAVSPDGERVAFVSARGDLEVMDVDGSGRRLLVSGHQAPRFDWSPDGRFLALEITDDDYNTDIHVVALEGPLSPDEGGPLNVTRHPDDETHPQWSPDGRKLAFAGTRSFDGDSDIYLAWLRQEDHEATARDLHDEEAMARFRPPPEHEPAPVEEGDEGEENDETDPDRDDPLPEVRIDPEYIHRRLHRISRFPGPETEVAVAEGGETIVFVASADGKRDLWRVRWDGEELERLTTGGTSPTDLEWNAKAKRLFYLSSGEVQSVQVSGKPEVERYAVRGRLAVDRLAERRQIFEEVWRTLDQHFYHPDRHGADWDRVRERAWPLARAAAHIQDFRDALRLMLGELNSSHQEIWDPPGEEGVPTGHLGIVPEPLPGGGVRVAEVLPEGPADRVRSRLQVGEVIEAVEGIALGPNHNLYERLVGTEGLTIRLTVRGVDGERREVDIRPTSRSSYRDHAHERDMRWRRELVDEWSNGRFGYVNLRHMGTATANQFERELYEVAHGKDGLVIDVRDNSGGWVTDVLLTSLTAPDHAVTIPRQGGPGYPADRRLYYAWTRPIVVLTSPETYSNGEIFAWAIQTSGRGQTLGEPTFGGVISTGQHWLLDRSRVRVPFRGWYVRRDGGATVNMEGTPFTPDVVMAREPDAYFRRIDPQLQAAVEVLAREPR
jgi:tricorn protease